MRCRGNEAIYTLGMCSRLIIKVHVRYIHPWPAGKLQVCMQATIQLQLHHNFGYFWSETAFFNVLKDVKRMQLNYTALVCYRVISYDPVGTTGGKRPASRTCVQFGVDRIEHE
jgi:hypothetical protein